MRRRPARSTAGLGISVMDESMADPRSTTSLSGGRTIGVISHVSEIKERFPDRIVVSQ
ncbi:hypothetical protein N9D51_00135 [Actinomycetota bacterium]|nr:hypothetical protein [Actinomycetota bacterium]